MAILKKTIDKILIGTSILGRILIIGLMGLIVYEVVARRFGFLGSIAIQELEWHFHGALFLLCLGFTYLKDAHVRVDIFRERFSPKTNRLIEIAGCLLFLLPYCGVVIYFGVEFTLKAYFNSEMSSAAQGLPYRWMIKSLIPIGFFLLGLSGVSILIGSSTKKEGDPHG